MLDYSEKDFPLLIHYYGQDGIVKVNTPEDIEVNKPFRVSAKAFRSWPKAIPNNVRIELGLQESTRKLNSDLC